MLLPGHQAAQWGLSAQKHPTHPQGFSSQCGKKSTPPPHPNPATMGRAEDASFPPRTEGPPNITATPRYSPGEKQTPLRGLLGQVLSSIDGPGLEEHYQASHLCVPPKSTSPTHRPQHSLQRRDVGSAAPQH